MIEEDGDIERLFATTIARQPLAALRKAVLARVAAELAVRHGPRQPGWQSWLQRAVAASVVFSVAVFLGVEGLESRRMARWDKRDVVRADVAQVTDAVASVTDESAAHRVEKYLLSQLPPDGSPDVAALDREIEAIQRWANGEPNTYGSQHETTQDRI